MIYLNKEIMLEAISIIRLRLKELKINDTFIKEQLYIIERTIKDDD